MKHDAIVIGSGAGGGAAAWALAQTGASVLLLEAGPAYQPHEDYQLHESTWEQTDFPAKVPTGGRQTFAPLQPLEPKWDHLRSWSHPRGRFVTGDRRLRGGYRHVVGLGGTTLHFTGEAHRLNPAAMRMKTRFGVAADWPLDYAELDNYYNTTERLLGVAGPPRVSQRPRNQPLPLPPHPASYASSKLGLGFKELGMSWEPNTLAALSRPYDGRPGCNYCGNCTRGCPRFDKGSVDVTFLPKAVATGRCTIRTECTVVRVEPGENDSIDSVLYRDREGREHEVKARAVVLSCGAVETPRLLLVSNSVRAREGIGNESGQLGKHFMETLTWVSSGLHPEPLGSQRGLPSDHICWDFNAPDAIPGVPGGCRFAPGMAESDLVGPINYARRVVPGWGHEHKQQMRTSFGRVLTVTAIGESLPNPGTYIDLDPEKTDANGLPRARINSRLDETEIRRLDFMAKTAREALNAAGVGSPFEEHGTYDTFNSTHVFGGCRSGLDPETSVVNSYGRSHRWRNLFVADASVFASSGGGESPSLTIEALAIRTGEHITQAMQRREL